MRNTMCLLLVSVMLCACSSSEASPSKSSTIDMQSSVSEESVAVSETSLEADSKSKTEEQNMYSETNADGIRLELSEVLGSDPVYALTFKKKDTNTDKYLNFIDPSDTKGDGIDDIDITLEPDTYFGYSFEPEGECHVDICNVDGNDTIKIKIADLEYTFIPNKEKTEEKMLDKKIQIKDESVTVKKAVFYPEYVALYLTDGTDKVYESMFLAIDAKGEKKGPIVYQKEDGKVLVYKKEDIMHNSALHLQVGQSNELENVDIELN